MSTEDHRVCHVCHGTKVEVDGGRTFPCHCCKPKQSDLSPTEAVIYGTTYAVVLDRVLRTDNIAPYYYQATKNAVKMAVAAAADAVKSFHEISDVVCTDFKGTETERLYNAAQKR